MRAGAMKSYRGNASRASSRAAGGGGSGGGGGCAVEAGGSRGTVPHHAPSSPQPGGMIVAAYDATGNAGASAQGGARRRGKCSLDAEKTVVKFKTKICIYFLQPSGCPYGDRCLYAHGADEMREDMTGTTPGTSTETNARYKTRMCRHWLASRGSSCPHGVRCTYAHGSEELDKYVAIAVAEEAAAAAAAAAMAVQEGERAPSPPEEAVTTALDAPEAALPASVAPIKPAALGTSVWGTRATAKVVLLGGGADAATTGAGVMPPTMTGSDAAAGVSTTAAAVTPVAPVATSAPMAPALAPDAGKPITILARPTKTAADVVRGSSGSSAAVGGGDAASVQLASNAAKLPSGSGASKLAARVKLDSPVVAAAAAAAIAASTAAHSNSGASPSSASPASPSKPALELSPEVAKAYGLGSAHIDSKTLAMGPARPGPAALREKSRPVRHTTSTAPTVDMDGAGDVSAADDAEAAEAANLIPSAMTSDDDDGEGGGGSGLHDEDEFRAELTSHISDSGQIEVKNMSPAFLATFLNRCFASKTADALPENISASMQQLLAATKAQLAAAAAAAATATNTVNSVSGVHGSMHAAAVAAAAAAATQRKHGHATASSSGPRRDVTTGSNSRRHDVTTGSAPAPNNSNNRRGGNGRGQHAGGSGAVGRGQHGSGSGVTSATASHHASGSARRANNLVARGTPSGDAHVVNYDASVGVGGGLVGAGGSVDTTAGLGGFVIPLSASGETAAGGMRAGSASEHHLPDYYSLDAAFRATLDSFAAEFMQNGGVPGSSGALGSAPDAAPGSGSSAPTSTTGVRHYKQQQHQHAHMSSQARNVGMRGSGSSSGGMSASGGFNLGGGGLMPADMIGSPFPPGFMSLATQANGSLMGSGAMYAPSGQRMMTPAEAAAAGMAFMPLHAAAPGFAPGLRMPPLPPMPPGATPAGMYDAVAAAGLPMSAHSLAHFMSAAANGMAASPSFAAMSAPFFAHAAALGMFAPHPMSMSNASMPTANGGMPDASGSASLSPLDGSSMMTPVGLMHPVWGMPAMPMSMTTAAPASALPATSVATATPTMSVMQPGVAASAPALSSVAGGTLPANGVSGTTVNTASATPGTTTVELPHGPVAAAALGAGSGADDMGTVGKDEESEAMMPSWALWSLPDVFDGGSSGAPPGSSPHPAVHSVAGAPHAPGSASGARGTTGGSVSGGATREGSAHGQGGAASGSRALKSTPAPPTSSTAARVGVPAPPAAGTVASVDAAAGGLLLPSLHGMLHDMMDATSGDSSGGSAPTALFNAAPDLLVGRA